jgi:hypothetical protein
MKDKFEYIIGGEKFFQTKLVWGQIKQIIEELEEVEIPIDFTIRDVLSIVGKKLPRLLAIVLIPEGKTARDKDVDKMIDLFEWELSAEQITSIIEDFFSCNPIPFWLEKIQERILGKTER